MASTQTLRDVMTTEPVVLDEKAIRRIPVVEGDQPLGIVSLGDLAIARDRKSALGQISAAPPSH